MRMTVKELIAELQTKDPRASVRFQTRMDGAYGPSFANGVQRVDNFGNQVVVVLDTAKTEV